MILANAGGISLLRGGLARGFAPIELTQAEGRITNSDSKPMTPDKMCRTSRSLQTTLNGVSVTTLQIDPRA